MSFTTSNSRKYHSKKMTFGNSLDHDKHKFQKKNIYVQDANIPTITTNIINVKKNINSPNAMIADTKIYYDTVTNTTRMISLTNNLNINNVVFAENGNVDIPENLNVDGNFRATDGIFNGDIMTNNANLLGDLVTTDCYVTKNLKIDGETMMSHAKINNLDINGLLAVEEMTANGMTINSNANIRNILTNSIAAPGDLNLAAELDHTINIPNIKYGIIMIREPIITATTIKLGKIFVVNNNTILQADSSCDGIEIIIFNNNISGNIAIRDTTNIIDTLCARSARRLLFLYISNCWVKI